MSHSLASQVGWPWPPPPASFYLISGIPQTQPPANTDRWGSVETGKGHVQIKQSRQNVTKTTDSK